MLLACYNLGQQAAIWQSRFSTVNCFESMTSTKAAHQLIAHEQILSFAWIAAGVCILHAFSSAQRLDWCAVDMRGLCLTHRGAFETANDRCCTLFV